MNLIFIDSNEVIGGIEALFIELAKNLSSKNKIFFIVHNNDNVYKKHLFQAPNIELVLRKVYKPVEYFSANEIKIEKRNISNYFNNEEEYCVIAPYFDSLQFAMAVFGDSSNFKLMHLWAHPQSWCTTLKIKNNDWFTRDKIKNSKYKYQKKLLETLYVEGADFYSSRTVPVFNSWYYEIDINPSKVEAVPIDSYNQLESWKYEKINLDSLSVLWVGRFDAWKNESIINIYETLERISRRYKEIKIRFDIVGYGNPKHEDYIRDRVFTNNVEVNFMGGVKPDNLPGLFLKYDLGIAMGLTVKKMGQIGLPSIIIDSFEKEG